jgi:hypothetical protein
MRRSTTILVPLLAITAVVLVSGPPAAGATLPVTDPGGNAPTVEVTVDPATAGAAVGLVGAPAQPAAAGGPATLESPLLASVRLAFASLPPSAQQRLPQILKNIEFGTP